MSESYRALCSDYYVNLKLNLKMELPRGRDTVLELFERSRKQYPAMSTFRRFKDELALESPQTDIPHRWVAVRANHVRSGTVNPPDFREAYTQHRFVLETAPYYMSISPLDVDYIELLYGFDLNASGNHDAIVFDALFAGSPIASLSDVRGAGVAECQPLVGLSFGDRSDLEVQFEVKTRPNTPAKDNDTPSEPISIYCTLRKFGSVSDIKDLAAVMMALSKRGEELVESKVLPTLLTPIREAIASA